MICFYVFQVTNKSKVFVANVAPSEHVSSKFTKIVDRFHLIISLYFVLPKTDKDTLEKLSIPSYVPPLPVDSTTLNSNSSNTHSLTNGHTNGPTATITPSPKKCAESGDVVDAVMNSPPIIQYIPNNKINHQTQSAELESNSEDSSLSDGDRTLVGDISPLAFSSPVAFEQQWSSQDEPKTNGGFYGDDDTDMTDESKPKDSYFKAVYYEEPATGESGEPTRILKVLVHKNLIIANLKRALEPHIQVPMEYFKIFRYTSAVETECSRLSEKLGMFK